MGWGSEGKTALLELSSFRMPEKRVYVHYGLNH